MLIDTHVEVWPLDDAPGHRPVEGAKVRAPDAAAPVEWLRQDMADSAWADTSWFRAPPWSGGGSGKAEEVVVTGEIRLGARESSLARTDARPDPRPRS